MTFNACCRYRENCFPRLISLNRPNMTKLAQNEIKLEAGLTKSAQND